MQPTSLLDGAVLLRPDNFTPLSRTPWAGTKIAEQYKNLVAPAADGLRIGEAWEFSCDPDFPSQLFDQNLNLSEFFASHASAIMSEDFYKQCYARSHSPLSELLVKLIDTRDPLSFQVHPADSDPELAAHECGKPESWLILEAAKGAGIYLGFQPGVSHDDLRQALATGADLNPFMQFVPVEPFDYFDLAPGVPHAIGAGVTLLEPQRLAPGKSGKTYRFWDWNRRYDKDGQLDAQNGLSRPLHTSACLRLVQPERQAGPAFVQTLRKTATHTQLAPGCELWQYPSSDYYRTQRVRLKAQSPAVSCGWQSGYSVLTLLSGSLLVHSVLGKTTQLLKGHTALLPFCANPFRFEASKDCHFALITPSPSACQWSAGS